MVFDFLFRKPKMRTIRKTVRPTVRLGLESLEERLAPVTDVFTNAAGGLWSVGSNWSLGSPPTSSQDATVTPSGSVTVTLSSGSDTVHTLTSNASLLVSGGSLSVTGNISGAVNVSGAGQLLISGTGSSTGNVTINVSGGATVTVSGSLTNTANTLTVSGSGALAVTGTLTGGTVTLTNGASLSGQNGTLNGVTVNGNLVVNGNDDTIIQNGLTLNGTATLGNSTSYGYLNFTGTETLGGTASVVFGSYEFVDEDGLIVANSATTLTIGANVTVSGQLGVVGSTFFQGSSTANVINLGTIEDNVSGGTIVVSGAADQNSGSLQALNGGALSLPGNITNSGTISVDATSSLTIAGTVTGGTINVTQGGQVNVTGTLSGVTLTGNLSGQDETLNGVTVNGNLVVNGNDYVNIQNGLTLNGIATLGNSTSYGYLNFTDTETLAGAASVVFGSYENVDEDGLIVTNSATTLTIGANVTVSGQLGVVGSTLFQGSSTGNVINQGTIQAINGGNITVESTTTNTGTVDVDGTSVLSLGGGTMTGGTITTQTGAQIVNGTLIGVTVNGNWQLVGNSVLTITNGLTLNGTLLLGNSTTYGYLNFTGTETLGGTASVVFGSYANGSTKDGLIVANSATLTIGASVTVSGHLGAVGSQGSGTCAVIDQGALQVSGGSTIYLAGTFFNNGTISIDGTSTLALGGGTLVGGTIATQSGAQIINGTLNGVTVNGNWQLVGNSVLTITNGLTLNGTLLLGNTTTYGYLNFSGTQTLGGTASVVFGSFASNIDYDALIVATAATTLTIGANITVSGQLGYIGYNVFQGSGSGNVINQGIIEANVSGGTITVSGAADQNSGSLQALNGSTLSLPGNITNAATISVDATSSLAMAGTVTGGTINITQGGQVTATGTLSGVTVNGNWLLAGNNSVTITAGLTLNGTVTLGNATTYGYLNFSGTQILGGACSVVFGSFASSFDYDALIVATAATTLTIGANVTVSGQLGYIGYNVFQGSGSGNVINQGTIQAINGGNITVESTTTNTGTVYVDGTSVLSLGGTTMIGGSITTQTGAQIVNGTLNGVTVNGNWQLVGNSSLTITNGLTLNGTLSLGNATTYGYLNFTGTETLGGTASVVFGSYASGSTKDGLIVANSATLTLGANVTVSGQLGAVGAQGSGTCAVIDQGALQVTGGSTIYLAGTFTNNGTISIDGTSTLALGGGTLVGGTITTQTGAQIVNGTLNGVTVTGNWQLVGNSLLTIKNGLTLNGTLSLGNTTTYGYLNFSGSQTLGGAGSVVFGSFKSSFDYDALIVATAATTLTIGANVTVSGQLGYIGYSFFQGSSTCVTINLGTITANVGGGTITIGAPGGHFTNSGTVNASLGAIAISTGAYGTVNNGTLAVGPTGTLSITGPFTQSAGGNVNVVLGGATTGLYGKVAISGTASFNGTLNVSEANGFSPAIGNVFTILTYTSATGQFASYTGLTPNATVALQPTYLVGSTTLNAISNIPPSITTMALPNATYGQAYSQTVTETGGISPYTFAVTTGSLPTGLSLNSSTGAITGTPSSVSGSPISFTVMLTDATGATATQNLAITVNQATTSTTVGTSQTGPFSTTTDFTFTATIASTPVTTVGAGTVTFYAGPGLTNPIGSPITVSGGSAVSVATTLPAGSDTVTAVYSGATNYSGSQGTTNLTVSATATTTTLTDNGPNASTTGQTVNLTGTVSSGVPIGDTVTLEDASNNNAVVATTTTGSSGSFAFNVSTLSAGTHDLFAVFAGDPTYATSQSGQVTQVVSLPPTVTSIVVNGDAGDNLASTNSRVASLYVTFSEPVQLGSGAFTLSLHNNVTINRTPGQQVGTLPATLNWSSSDNIHWTVTFAGTSGLNVNVGADGHVTIMDGVYDLTVVANQVQPYGVSGVSMASNFTQTFWALFGDTGVCDSITSGTIGDGNTRVAVGNGDFNEFANAYQATGYNVSNGYVPSLDVDGDGSIGNVDFNALANNYQTCWTF